MKKIVAIGFVACWGIVVACGGSQKSSAMMPAGSAQSPEAGAAPMPGDPRNEIERLAAEIDTALAGGGVATLAPASCETTHSCTAEPFGMPPRVEDPTCKAPTTDLCTQACTLSDSVCTNADKICELAAQLGRNDEWANEKCQSANDACKRTREKCCAC